MNKICLNSTSTLIWIFDRNKHKYAISTQSRSHLLSIMLGQLSLPSLWGR